MCVGVDLLTVCTEEFERPDLPPPNPRQTCDYVSLTRHGMIYFPEKLSDSKLRLRTANHT